MDYSPKMISLVSSILMFYILIVIRLFIAK